MDTEGISVIVNGTFDIMTDVCTEDKHKRKVASLQAYVEYRSEKWIPLKKLGLCQEYYK